MKLKDAQGQLLEQVESLYRSAFPEDERMPFSAMLKRRQDGAVKMFAVESDDGDFDGMAITMEYEDMALLAYFAISSGRRGEGIGSEAFQMLRDLFGEKRFFIEVESTSVASENAQEREERKVFYHVNGMRDTTLTVCLKGVELDILVRSDRITYDEYYRFYEGIFGEKIAGKIEPVRE